MPRDDKICLGVIAAPHGVRGLVRVKSFTERPQDIAAYGEVQFADGRKVDLSVHGLSKGFVLIKISGVDSRNQAEELKGAELYVLRKQLPEADADDVYQADLIGLDLFDSEQGRIGRITAVFDFGAGAMLEVKPKKGESVLVPFGGKNPIEIDDKGAWLKVDKVWLDDNPE